MGRKMSIKGIISFLLLVALLVLLAACGNKVEESINKYTLSISTEGEGTIEPAEGMHQYDESTIVTLSTTTDTANGWYFNEWGGPNGDEVSEDNLLMNGDKSITAIFSKSEYSLNVTIDPVDAGQVYKEILASIQSIEHGETVRLTAVGNNGYAFDHWEEDLSGSENPVNMGMDSNRNVTAVFTKLDYNLNISVYPENSGTVSKSIDSGNAYEYDQIVTITANPAEGYVFDHWEGDLSANTNPVEVTMVSEKNITAVFIKKEYDLMVNITPAGAGTVDKVILPTIQSIEHGELVRLTATGNPGYVFDYWEGDLSGSENPINLTMDGDIEVTAVFESAIYGRVVGRSSVDGIAGLTINFSDGNSTITDSQGYWVQRGIFGTLTVTPVVPANYLGKVFAPINRKINWPTDDINFTFSGYSLIGKWGSLGSGDGQFNSPDGIVEDSSGNIYVVDAYNHRIQKYDGTGWSIFAGTVSQGSGDGQFYYPSGIAVDNSGNIYVVDSGNQRIQVFDSAGNFIKKWGSPGSGDGEFNNPYGIAVDDSGILYVSDSFNHRIQKYDGTNWSIFAGTSSPGSGDDEFNNPRGIAVDDSGNIYVVDTYNDRVQVFDSAGNLIRTWGSTGGGDSELDYPYGIAVDNSGNIYVVDCGNNRIQVFDSAGNFINKWGSYGSGNGEFDYPYGIAVDDSGDIYVTDCDNHRIQEFKLVD